MNHLLNQTELAHALSIPDLTDPAVAPSHAMEKLIRLAKTALTQTWQCTTQTIRSSPVVPVENNYDRLNYPKYGAARDARYTRYVTERYILRTQTSSAIPDSLAGLDPKALSDLLLILPGMVYRRDCIDRLHCAEPHQLDLWRIVNHRHLHPMTESDLKQMVKLVIGALLPGRRWRTIPSAHPYTQQGVQIDVWWQDCWVEVGECGLIEPTLLTNSDLKLNSGLAMGLGLDRILMIRKNIPDIRLIRHTDRRIQEQMNDLSQYQEVSMMPSITRDLSLVVDEQANIETLGDKVRQYCSDYSLIEALSLVNETPYEQLPAKARARLAINRHQKNVVLRLVVRALDRTLTAKEANRIRNEIYHLLHEGEVTEIAENRT